MKLKLSNLDAVQGNAEQRSEAYEKGYVERVAQAMTQKCAELVSFRERRK